MVVSASQGGKTRLGVIPHGCLVEVQAKVSRYQELRRSLSAATKKDGHLMVVCLLGGIHNFFGPMVGSIVFIFLDKLITSFTQYWPFVLGVVVLALVLFLRGGIAGSIAARIALRSER
jgi:VIT1/CCC1 family predicted Fe2+/Mn2+ transporter